MHIAILELHAEFYKAVGNTSRLRILHVMRKGPSSVGDVARGTGLSQSLVSRQLGILRNAGILKCHRHANEMVYELTNEDVGQVCDLVTKILCAQLQNQSRIF